MEKKPVARIISIDSAKNRAESLPENPQPPTPQANKRKTPGRSAYSIRCMYWKWRIKASEFHRVSVECIDEQVIEAMEGRRAA